MKGSSLPAEKNSFGVSPVGVHTKAPGFLKSVKAAVLAEYVAIAWVEPSSKSDDLESYIT